MIRQNTKCKEQGVSQGKHEQAKHQPYKRMMLAFFSEP